MDRKISEFIKLYTYSDLKHGIRVAELANELMFYIGLNDKKRKAIYTGAVLHDIGKYRLCNKLLDKPGSLNNEERLLIQEHVVYGYELLRSKNMNQEILETILYHHENYNGSGYPSHLKGKDIPVGARIVRICDTFDAITNDRPYQSKQSIEKALDIMDLDIVNFDPLLYGFFKDIVIKNEKHLFGLGGF